MRLVQWICLIVILLLLILPTTLLLSAGYKPLELKGMQTDAPRPEFSLKSFAAGSYQKEFGEYFNQHFALRSEYVKFTNQLYYDLFAKSYMYKGDLVIGKQDYIYERYYLDDYTTVRASAAELETLLADIEWLQQKLKERGKVFCFIITPSKVKTLPEYVPEQYKELVKRQDLPYNQMRSLLADTAICYVDGQALFNEEAAKSDRMLFTKGGTHWNEYGAALMAQALFRELDERYKLNLAEPKLHDLRFAAPKGTDRDLYDLLNVWREADYPATEGSWQFGAAAKRPYNLGIVGGSFCWNLVDFVQKTKQFEPLEVYYYYRLGRARFVEGKRSELPTLDKQPSDKWRSDLLSHDIILLELNSSMPIEPVQEFLAAAKACL